MDSIGMLKIPLFAMGTYDNLAKELAEGGHFADLSTIMYAYVKDKEMLAFVHPSDKKLNLIVGNNKRLVENLNKLPSVVDGDRDVLYIVGDTVYTFDGTKYVPTYQNVTERLNQVVDLLDSKADKANTLAGYGITDAYSKTDVDSAVTSAVTEAREYVDNSLKIIRY